ncbi:hypothetical protein C882_0422 [Caenispirillum salinarum AK4]|uniref:Uncharacterized protein n=1 Tax=Caenispirillum salinarum AK4 TaxID=1238182 RepID=K9GXW3_9PROT|nr:hypothetical protein C882_0422 [Caenispirillum salinarum AK4]
MHDSPSGFRGNGQTPPRAGARVQSGEQVGFGRRKHTERPRLSSAAWADRLRSPACVRRRQ